MIIITMQNAKQTKLELDRVIAPNTVNNFVSLVNKGFYDGIIFHRCIPGFVIQGGDPTGSGMGGPGYSIEGEFNANGIANDLHHDEGVLSMARAQDPNSAGSQFFICVGDAGFLDGNYAGFGKIIEGMEVALDIAETEVNMMDKPLRDQKMLKVTVETFGEEYPEPEIC